METANGEEPPAGPPVSLHGRRLLRVGGACPTPLPVLQRLPPSALHHTLHCVPRRVCVSPLGQVTRIPPVRTVRRAPSGLLPQRRGGPSWWPPSGVARGGPSWWPPSGVVRGGPSSWPPSGVAEPREALGLP
uniref:Putative uncharacterized protein FLJ45684 n=1 Tax=Homo sapiens TaxID=9606 RepID=YS025_HUMAN|nr:RecName: Full=Putative uncharacterized protein FLJ45684 [Homo sapiens]